MPKSDVVTAQLRDNGGDVGMCRFRVAEATGDASILDVIEPLAQCSGMQLKKVSRTATRVLLGTPAVAPGVNPLADDKAMLVLSFGVTETGAHVYISIPGPKPDLMPNNDLRIDPADETWDDLKAAVAALVTTQGGTEADGDLETGLLQTHSSRQG